MPVTVAPFRTDRAPSAWPARELHVPDEGSAVHGRLTFGGGAAELRLAGGARPGELVSLDVLGKEPRVRAWQGDVDVQTPSFLEMLFAGWPFVPSSLSIGLCSRVPWAIECRGGASQVDADLRALSLASLTLTGGCASMVLALPRPSGVIPVRFRGGLAQAFVMRPMGTPIRISVSGGACAVRFDGHVVGPTAGQATWESDDWDGTSGYDVHITGGVADLTVHEGRDAPAPIDVGPYRSAPHSARSSEDTPPAA